MFLSLLMFRFNKAFRLLKKLFFELPHLLSCLRFFLCATLDICTSFLHAFRCKANFRFAKEPRDSYAGVLYPKAISRDL